MLMEPSSHSIDSAHPQLVLSKEVLIAANYKLIVAQPFFKFQNNGWKAQNGTWSSENSGLPPEDCTFQTLSPASSFFPVPHNASLKPCLYDIRKDPSERHNLAEQLPAIVEELWAALNTTILTQRDCRCATHALLSPHLWCHTKLRHAPPRAWLQRLDLQGHGRQHSRASRPNDQYNWLLPASSAGRL